MMDTHREMLIALTVIASRPPVTETDHYLAGELNSTIARAKDCLERVEAATGGIRVSHPMMSERMALACTLLMQTGFVARNVEGFPGDLADRIDLFLASGGGGDG